jgi:hypothetical protein
MFKIFIYLVLILAIRIEAKMPHPLGFYLDYIKDIFTTVGTGHAFLLLNIYPAVSVLFLYSLLIYYRYKTNITIYKIILVSMISSIIISILLAIVGLETIKAGYENYMIPDRLTLIAFILGDWTWAFPILSIVSIIGKLISDRFRKSLQPWIFIISVILILILHLILWNLYLSHIGAWDKFGID